MTDDFTRIAYQEFHRTLPDVVRDAILEFIITIFPQRGDSTAEERERRIKRIAEATNLFVVAGFDGNNLAGFKMGYQTSPEDFYSWLGAVVREYRKQGIGSELMQRQHEWCKQQGYKRITTRTTNQWRNMLILNLRHGFDIVNVVLNDYGEERIVLVKKF